MFTCISELTENNTTIRYRMNFAKNTLLYWELSSKSAGEDN